MFDPDHLPASVSAGLPEVNTCSDVVILIPVWNDWQSVFRLLPLVDEALATSNQRVDVVLVDDGSNQRWRDFFDGTTYRNLGSVTVLTLKRNVGHQRAICLGMAWLHERRPQSPILVMDGDGEDAPGDVPRLIEAFHAEDGAKVVFAARARRSEAVLFRLLYGLYKLMHFLLVGHKIQVGNFSIVPPLLAAKLSVVSEMWNHYAAAVFKGRLPYTTIPTHRGERLCGHSHMNFVSLVVHGLSAMAVFSERVGVRMLVFFMAAGGVTLVAMGALLWYAGSSLLDWSIALVNLMLIFLLLILGATVLVVAILSGRQQSSFVPLRDYRWFVAENVENVC